MIDRAAFNRSVAFLRKQFLWSEEYRAARKRCFFAKDAHICEGCQRIICRDEISEARVKLIVVKPENFDISIEKFAIDHIVPVGSLTGLDEAAAKIFCSLDNLMGLCGTCHYFKTQVDNEETRSKKKGLLERIEIGELDDSNQ